jgi:hypothetical protein
MSKNGHKGKSNKLPDYATKKPIAITPDGHFVLPSEAAGSLTLGIGSLSSLDASLQQKLVLERIKLDPKYNLATLSGAKYTKEEVLAHVEKQTQFGQRVIRAELSYCDEYVAELSALPAKPLMPLPKIKPIEPIVPPWKPKKKIRLWVKNTVVFCENTTDGATRSAALYRILHVHPVFAQQGFHIVSLEGVHDNRQEFEAAAKAAFVVYISGVGHGGPATFTGDGNSQTDPILQVGAYDPAEVKGKAIHLLSCQTAKQLGPDVVAKGAKAYSGYYENFNFVWDDPNTPGDEQEPFWRCDSTFDICMAQGYTVAQAHQATIAAYNAAIAAAANTAAATWLTWDRNYFRSPVVDAVYGDPAAKAPSMTGIWIYLPFAVSDLVSAERVKA